MLKYELATQGDSEAIKALQRRTAMQGRISLAFESQLPRTNPVEYDRSFHQTLIARDTHSDTIHGLSTRSGSEVYLNGEVSQVGYLGMLRLDQQYRHGIPLKLGVKFIKELHQDQRVPFYLTSIMEDNETALRMLTANLPGFLRYDTYCRLITHTLSTRVTKMKPLPVSGLQIRKGTKGDIPDILDCLTRNGKLSQFSPAWTEETLFHPDHTPNLNPADFLIAIEGEGLVGCLAVWDQRPLHKIIIQDYEPQIKYFRGIINLFSRLTRLPHLPPVGSELPHAFLCMVAIDNDDTGLFLGLVNAALAHAGDQGIDLLMAGFPDQSPFEKIVTKNFNTIMNPSLIYLVSLPEDKIAPLDLIDERSPGLEIALL